MLRTQLSRLKVVLMFACCVILSKSPNLSEPELPCGLDGNNAIIVNEGQVLRARPGSCYDERKV